MVTGGGIIEDSVGRANDAAFSFAIASGLEPGRELGRYRLVRRVGEGGFAEVWLAMEEGEHSIRKKVALKILKEATSDQHAYESLLNEARLCGMLHHLHIVDVYGVSQADGLTFVAMEYVEGITLDRLLRRITAAEMSIPLSVILEVGIGIAEALDHSHNALDPEGRPLNIVHRDLKPGNVMLAPGLGVKVADFGLAKATTSRNETMIGEVRGTPGYIAPEVWGGTRDFGPRVDLFALGVLLWEMATGRKLFEGSMIEVMGQCMHGEEEAEMDTLRRHRPELVPIVERLLRRQPDRRTGTAWEVLVALREVLEVVHAPGGLDLFLELLGVTGSEQRLSGGRRSLRGGADESWAQLMVMAGYSAPDLPAVSPSGLHEPPAITDSMFPPIARASRRVGWLPGAIAGVVALFLLGAFLWQRGGPSGDEVAAREPALPADSVPERGATRVPSVPLAPQDLASAPAVPDTPDPAEGPAPATQPETRPREAVEAAAPAPRPAPAVGPAPEPTPAVGPAPEPTPAVVASRPSAPPVALDAPVPPHEAVPEPVAPPTSGCVVFQSFPPGADVLVGGARTGLVALGGDATRRTYPVGPLSVAMASEGATLATAAVQVEGGGRTIVRCDLLKGGDCTVRRAAGSCD